jgi:Lhr-like helicase
MKGLFIEIFQCYRNGSRTKFNRYYNGISEKVKSLIEQMLFLNNRKHAERTIAHLREVMVQRNVMTKAGYKLQK